MLVIILSVKDTLQFDSICTEEKSKKIVFIDEFNGDQLNSLYWTFTDQGDSSF